MPVDEIMQICVGTKPPCSEWTKTSVAVIFHWKLLGQRGAKYEKYIFSPIIFPDVPFLGFVRVDREVGSV